MGSELYVHFALEGERPAVRRAGRAGRGRRHGRRARRGGTGQVVARLDPASKVTRGPGGRAVARQLAAALLRAATAGAASPPRRAQRSSLPEPLEHLVVPLVRAQQPVALADRRACRRRSRCPSPSRSASRSISTTGRYSSLEPRARRPRRGRATRRGPAWRGSPTPRRPRPARRSARGRDSCTRARRVGGSGTRSRNSALVALQRQVGEADRALGADPCCTSVT